MKGRVLSVVLPLVVLALRLYAERGRGTLARLAPYFACLFLLAFAVVMQQIYAHALNSSLSPDPDLVARSVDAGFAAVTLAITLLLLAVYDVYIYGKRHFL
ncbi:MAG: hypothetical protein QXT28_09240 [Thermofilaceae archaeon]